MGILQKQNLNVSLLGLDEKANPRTAALGTIVDGRNWQMTREGRIEKRPGSAALAMLDTLGVPVTGVRELAALGDELIVSNGKQVYARNPISGQWTARGNAAYERLDISSVVATAAPCDGMDSCLQMDCAQIGRYVLILMAGGVNVGDTHSLSGWMVVDGTTGEMLVPFHYNGMYGMSAFSDGHTASQTFVAFGILTEGALSAQVWDQTNGFSTGIISATLFSDLCTASDGNTYTLQPGFSAAAPYSAIRVDDNVWIVAYQDSGGTIKVRKVTRTSGANFTVTAATTVIGTGGTFDSAALAWAYNPGDTTATLAATAGQLIIYWATIAVSDLTVTGATENAPGSWNGGTAQIATCRGVTGVKVAGVATFLFDVEISWGGRSVWIWQPQWMGPVKLLIDCGLLTQAFIPATGDADELGVGIAYSSTWQPSAFIMRVHVGGSSLSIGAHLQNGNFAGRPMSQLLPNMAAPLALGVLNNPISLGGPGTVLVELAQLTQTTHSTASPPCEIGNTLLLPGACLKSYDGEAVTEGAFVLGPESISASEGATGLPLVVDSASTMGTVLPANGSVTAVVSAGSADVAFTGPANTSMLWPTGNVTVNVWAWVTGGSGTYSLGLRPAAEANPIRRHTQTTGDYQYAVAASIPARQNITGSPALYTFVVPVLDAGFANPPLPTDQLVLELSLTGTDGAILHIGYGAGQPTGIVTLFPVIEVGQREYCALAMWTDAQGRIQRSQICPAVSCVNTNGLSNAVTVRTLNITERDPLTNINNRIAPTLLEIYRTGISDPIFYRVASLTNIVNGASLSYTDSADDNAIQGNEQLYTTGGAVQNWPPIGANLVASHQGRVFVATADGNVFFSAYAQSGESLAFAAEYQIEVEHIIGGITALLSLDDNLAVCTATSYAVLTGVGPEATGLPAYDSPTLVGSGIGPLSQRACARTPTGIVMVTAHGAQMFDRGLNLAYVGIQEESDVPDSVNWWAAAFHPGKNQTRLYADGLATVYDWTLSGPPGRQSQFFKWAYATTIVAAAISSGNLYQLGADGVVYLADQGFADAGTAYQEWIQLSVVSAVGPNGWSRVYAGRFACDLATGSTLKLVLTPEEGNLSTTDTMTLAGPQKHIPFKPRYGRCSSMIMWIGENAATTTAGLTLDAIGLLVGNKGGLGRMPAASRMVRS